MKKKCLVVFSLIFCFVFIFSQSSMSRKVETVFAQEVSISEKIPYKQLGSFLSGSATASNGTFESHPSQIYNNSGMDGDDGITHKHSNNAQKMWRSTSEASISQLTPIIELDMPNQLGLMFVWNYNAQGQTDIGLKDVVVSHSIDKENWTTLGEFTLARASGEAKTKATNLHESGSPIDFAGAYAKYVRITPKAANGNWGGNAYGLSEVKIYEFKVEAKPNAYIKAGAYGASTTSFFRAVETQSMLTDGSGLSDPKSSKALHDNNPENMWASTSNTLLFNLYGMYPLSDMYIWNYNEPININYGVKNITVEYSTDPTDTWKKLGDFKLDRGNGSLGVAANRIPFNNITTQLVRITIKDNYGGSMNGLSAVRFYCGEGDYYESAHEWTSVLSNYDGTFGYDGIFSASMGGDDYGKSLDERSAEDMTWFVFSDTDVVRSGSAVDEVTRTSNSFEMPNNTFATFVGNDAFDGEMLRFYMQSGKNGQYHLTPSDKSNGARWWLGDTMIHDGKVYLTPHRVENYDGGMGFQHTGGTMISFDINSTTGLTDFTGGYTEYDDDKNPYMTYFDGTTNILMNAGFFANTLEAGAPNPDGYVYNYGNYNYNGGRYLVTSRVKLEDFEDLSKYRYYDGENWVEGIENSERGPANVSPELSVTPVTYGENAGKYMLLYQQRTQSAQTAVRFADTPWGPWSEAQVVHNTVEPFYMSAIYSENAPTLAGGPYCYNAKAHPALSKAGETIFSYNMNHMGGAGHDGHLKNIDNYSPRFLRHTTTGSVSVGDNSGVGTSLQFNKVESITLSDATLSLLVEQTYTLTATVLPQNADNTSVIWSSSNASVVSVNENGEIEALSVGTATISASAVDGSGESGSCVVTVTLPKQVSSITLDKSAATMNVGETLTLIASVSPLDASNTAIRWRTSDPTIATVDSEGKVTAKKVGEVTIKAEATDGSEIYAECFIFIEEPPASNDDEDDDKKGCGAMYIDTSSQIGTLIAIISLGVIAVIIKRKKQIKAS